MLYLFTINNYNMFFNIYIYKDISKERYNTYAKVCNSILYTKH